SDVVVSGLVVYATSWLLCRALVQFELADLLQRLSDGIEAHRRLAAAAIAMLAIPLSMVFLDRPLALFFHDQSETLHAIFRIVTEFGVSTGWLVGTALLFIALRLAAWRTGAAPIASRLHAYSGLPLFFFVAVAVPGLVADLLKGIVGRARPKLLFSQD